MTGKSWSPKLIIVIMAVIFLLTGCNSGENIVNRNPDPDDKPYSRNISNQEVNKFLSSVRKVDGAIEAKYRMARHFQKRNKHKVAIVELKDIIQIAPTFVKAYNAIGFSYDSLGDFKKAIRFYKLALKINPNLDYLHNNLGFSYLLCNNYDAAINAFQKAIALNEQSKRFRNNLGFTYAKKGQYDLAIKQFRLTGDEFSANYRLGQILYREGKYAKALEYNENAYQAKASAKILSSVPSAVKKKSSQADDAVAEKDMRSQSAALPSNAERKSLVNDKKKPWPGTPPLFKNENEIERPGAKISKAGPVIISKSIKADSRLSVQHETKTAQIINSGPEDKRKEIRQPNHQLIAARQFILNEIDKDMMKAANDEERQLNNAIVEIEIVVSNGNGVDGMASRLGRYLRERGFKVTHLQNANYFNHEKTKILYYSSHSQDVSKLLQEIPGHCDKKNVIELEHLSNHIKILIGKDLIPYDRVISGAQSIKTHHDPSKEQAIKNNL